MSYPLILASASTIRSRLLTSAEISHDISPARIDEQLIKQSLISEGLSSRDISDALADHKAAKQSNKYPDHLVLGCDQIADFQGNILTKPNTPELAHAQIKLLMNSEHQLYSAAVLYLNGKPLWRFIGVCNMQMRHLSDQYINDYVERNFDSIRESVGGYKLEEEGVRLFSKIDGNYFHVLGLPLTELITFLIQRGDLKI